MKKILFSIGLVSLLSGCYYSNGCFYNFQMVNCREWSNSAGYQKKETEGHTDIEQRWKDIEACGAEKSDYFFLLLQRKAEDQAEKEGKDLNQVTEAGVNVLHQFSRCMESKGYHYNDCGTKNTSTSPYCNE